MYLVLKDPSHAQETNVNRISLQSSVYGANSPQIADVKGKRDRRIEFQFAKSFVRREISGWQRSLEVAYSLLPSKINIFIKEKRLLAKRMPNQHLFHVYE